MVGAANEAGASGGACAPDDLAGSVQPAEAGAGTAACGPAASPEAAKRTIRGVLFDLDGTLLDTYELISASFHHCMVDVLGEDRSMELFDSMLGQPLAIQLAAYEEDPAVVEKLLASYREHNARAQYELLQGFAGMTEALEELHKRGYVLGVATAKLHNPAAKNLEIAGILGYFDCIVGADDAPRSKPAPDSILEGARLLGLDPSSCAYVGDSPFDIQAGNAAGCPTIAVHWGQHPLERLLAAGPTVECLAPCDLPDVVGNLG